MIWIESPSGSWVDVENAIHWFTQPLSGPCGMAGASGGWLAPPVVREMPTRDVLLGVDLSLSMGTEDFTTRDGRKTSRLAAVKGVLDEFLQHRRGDRVAFLCVGVGLL